MRIERSMVLPYFQADTKLRRRIKKTLEDHVVHEDDKRQNQHAFQQETSEEFEEETAEETPSTGFHIIA